jgi:chemotaxis signal transduction protein
MIDLIVFSVGDNKYAMDIEYVQRIIQAKSLTNIPNSHDYLDGMISYEKKVIKVLNFRKLIGMNTYENELGTLFSSLVKAHAAWVEALKISLETGSEFTKTFDSHACGLGKWIDSFTAYDDHVLEVVNNLVEYHKQLHSTGAIAYGIREEDKDKALEIFNKDIMNIYQHTMGALETFIKELDIVADSLQKFLIYENSGSIFAIKVDAIEDIAHVQEDDFISSAESETSEFLDLSGILDFKGVLINVIKTVKLPK